MSDPKSMISGGESTRKVDPLWSSGQPDRRQFTHLDLAEAKRRYANARRRARYWSGTLTFNIHLRSKETRSSRLHEKYELAMCDCKSWEAAIGGFTGKVLKHYDPKSAFAARWAKIQ